MTSQQKYLHSALGNAFKELREQPGAIHIRDVISTLSQEDITPNDIMGWVRARVSGADSIIPYNTGDGESNSSLLESIIKHSKTSDALRAKMRQAILRVFEELLSDVTDSEKVMYCDGVDILNSPFVDLSLFFPDITPIESRERLLKDLVDTYEKLSQMKRFCIAVYVVRSMRAIGFTADPDWWIGEWQKNPALEKQVFQALMRGSPDSLFTWLETFGPDAVTKLCESQSYGIRKFCEREPQGRERFQNLGKTKGLEIGILNDL